MHLAKGRFSKIKSFFQNRGKKFWIPIFVLMIAGLGFGTWSIIRTAASSGSAYVTKQSNSRTLRGVTADSSYIRYGVREDNSSQTWGTYRYNVSTSSGDYTGMCLQPNIQGPNGETFSITTDTSSDALITKELMLVSMDLSSSVAQAFENSYPTFWDDLSQQIQNFRTRDTSVGYASSYYYTDYYYNYQYATGCKPTTDAECALAYSTVPKDDYVFALGHMMIGSLINQVSTGLTTAEAQAVESAARTILSWYNSNSNSAYKAVAQNTVLYSTVVPTTSNVQRIGWIESVAPSTISVRIRKVSSDNTSTGLQGATFYLCEVDESDNDYNCQGPYTTGSTGYTQYVTVSSRHVRWYETGYPSGYTCQSPLSTSGTYGNCYGIESVSDNETIVVENTPVPTAYIKIKKVNSVNSGVSYAGLTVVGTVFSVKSGSTEVATITIGADGTGTTTTSLPVGTYTITEKTATTGYNTNSNSLTVTLNSSNTATSPKTVDMTSSAFSNTPIYGKISLTKTGYEMAENGSATTRNLAGVYFTAVNKNDSSITYTIGPTASDGSATSPSMVYGTYTVTEVRGDHNKAYELISFDATVNDSSTYSQGTKQDSIPDKPGLTTIARNANSTYDNPDKELEIAPNASVTDRITCSGLESGSQYKLEGTLYNLSSGSTTGSTGASTFTATSSGTCGDLDMVFSVLDTSNYIDKKLSIKQILYKNNGTSSSPDWVRIFIHNANLTETNEQIKVKNIKIETVATTTRTNNKQLAAGNVTVNDAIQITGLTNGQSYTVEGVLKDSNGNNVSSASTTYSMTATTGTPVSTSLAFTLDSTPYVGQSLTVTITLKNSSGATLVTHTTSDGSETVSVLTPEIGTTAINGRDITLNEQELEVGETTIQDTVTYKGLVSGDTYTIKGEVHKLNSDGSDSGTVVSTATKSFTATGEDNLTGEIVTFDIDTIASCAVDNKLTLPCKFVVYEYIYFGTHSSPFTKHEDPSDTNQILSVKQPTLVTAASDIQNDTKKLPVGTTTVMDRVTYDHLMPGQTYILKGKLMEVDPTTGTTIVERNGTSITATESFPAAATTGTITIDGFNTFDTTFYYDYSLGDNQRQYVVYQSLYYGDILLVAHEDPTDENQTVQIGVPILHTDARYKNRYDGNSSKLLGVGDVTMIDYVDYEGLVEGEWYTIKGYIVDPTTGDIVKIDDEYVENSKTFKADSKGKGQVALEINVNTITLQGKSFVVYEELYRSPRNGQDDDRLLAEHKEALDEGDQTIGVKTASLGTTASDNTKDADGNADGDDVIDHEAAQVILDKIHYDGLLMDEDYTIYGYLWDKTNNTPLLDADNKRIEGYISFTTPTRKDNGDLEMEFTVDATDLPGVEIVVYEYLFTGDKDDIPLGDDGYPDTEQVVTKHENPDDEDQTVRVALRVGTEAVDAYDNDHKLGVGQVKVTDNLKYEGVTIGKTYVAKGWLVYKNDGDGHKAGDKVKGLRLTCVETPITISDEEDTESDETTDSDSEDEDSAEPETEEVCTREYFDIEGTATFVAGSEGYEETTGSVLITFMFDSRELVNEELVVYEELYVLDGDGTETFVAEHKDLEDEGQLVVVDEPTIHTVATDKSDGDHELAKNGQVTITDKVNYTGLVPGTTYILHGELIDKKSGNRLTASGVTEVTWEFTPTGSSGSESLDFVLTADDLNGKSIVVYEELYILPTDEEDGEKIAEHKDINDEDQTVWIGPATPNTGLFGGLFGAASQSNLIIFITGGIALGLSGYAYLRRRTRVRRGEISFE